MENNKQGAEVGIALSAAITELHDRGLVAWTQHAVTADKRWHITDAGLAALDQGSLGMKATGAATAA